MYNHATENYNCPFCHVALGEPTERGSQEQDVVYRDELVTAFICSKFWRSNPGHILIISNKHYENIYDLPEEVGHRIFDASKQIAMAFRATYGCHGVSTRQHNEPAGNQNVWHYHMHVFPRYEGDNFYHNHDDTYWPTPEEKKTYSDKLKKYFNFPN